MKQQQLQSFAFSRDRFKERKNAMYRTDELKRSVLLVLQEEYKQSGVKVTAIRRFLGTWRKNQISRKGYVTASSDEEEEDIEEEDEIEVRRAAEEAQIEVDKNATDDAESAELQAAKERAAAIQGAAAEKTAEVDTVGVSHAVSALCEVIAELALGPESVTLASSDAPTRAVAAQATNGTVNLDAFRESVHSFLGKLMEDLTEAELDIRPTAKAEGEEGEPELSEVQSAEKAVLEERMTIVGDLLDGEGQDKLQALCVDKFNPRLEAAKEEERLAREEKLRQEKVEREAKRIQREEHREARAARKATRDKNRAKLEEAGILTRDEDFNYTSHCLGRYGTEEEARAAHENCYVYKVPPPGFRGEWASPPFKNKKLVKPFEGLHLTNDYFLAFQGAPFVKKTVTYTHREGNQESDRKADVYEWEGTLFDPNDPNDDIPDWRCKKLMCHMLAARAECHAVLDNWNSAFGDQQEALAMANAELGEHSPEFGSFQLNLIVYANRVSNIKVVETAAASYYKWLMEGYYKVVHMGLKGTDAQLVIQDYLSAINPWAVKTFIRQL